MVLVLATIWFLVEPSETSGGSIFIAFFVVQFELDLRPDCPWTPREQTFELIEHDRTIFCSKRCIDRP
jgi:hypothetical protein